MCGIAGYIGSENIHEDNIRRTLALMKNRGPDFQDYLSFHEGDVGVTLLHSRLSIIDLDRRAHQPMTIGGVTIIYNGEIYNYLELRKELEERGVRFTTSSDTEVLLRGYLEYGREFQRKMEGMWAFAVYDRRTGELLLSRDRFAEKPLYYMKSKSGVFFASETKFIRSLSGAPLAVNRRHLLRYLVNGYKALYKTEDTFFEAVAELPFASNMTLDGAGRMQLSRYWSPQYSEQRMTLDEAIEGTRHWLTESVRLRLRADVPLAFCLSGGIDSASLASIAAKTFGYRVATFSIIDSDERYNEEENIRATIDNLGCEHTLIEVSRDHFLPRLRDLIAYHDAPLSTISYYVHAFLSEAIARGGFKVAVSGTAADELFTGYYDHFNLHLYEMRHHPDLNRRRKEWETHIAPIVRNPFLQNPLLYFDHPSIRDHIYLDNDIFAGCLVENFAEAFTEECYAGSLLRNRMLNELFHESIPVILHEDDLNSMYHSIENRSPFLDSRLFAFAYSIPAEHLISDGYGKYVLREAVKGILNEKVRTDRKKVGFNASIHSLIDFDAPDIRAFLLEDAPVFEIIRKERIEEIMKVKPMSNSYSKFMFNFINVKLFLDAARDGQPHNVPGA